MIVKCLSCRQEMALNYAKFQNYQGPVRCFACGATMNIRSVRGVIGSVNIVGGGAGFLLGKRRWPAFKKPHPWFGKSGRFSPGKKEG